MEVSQIVLNGIKNFAKNVQSTQVGQFLGRNIIYFKGSQIPAVALAVTLVVAAIFIACKYNTNKPQPNPPVDEKDIEISLEEVSSEESSEEAVLSDGSSSDVSSEESSEESVSNKESDVENVSGEESDTGDNLLSVQDNFVPLTESAIRRKFESSGIFEKVNDDVLDNLLKSRIKGDISPEDFCKSTLEFGLNEKAQDIVDPNKLIAAQFTLLVGQKLNGIYLASQKMIEVLEKAKKNGTRLACATFTVLGSLGRICSGDFLGGITLACALKEFYNIKNEGTNLNLEDVFRDVKKDFAVLDQLGGQSKQALNGIGTEIINAKLKINEVTQVFERIEKIIKEGDSELKNYENEICQLKKKALRFNEKAIIAFEKSQQSAEQANIFFNKCWSDIENLGIAKDLDLSDAGAPKKVEEFIACADRLKINFAEGMKSFTESQDFLNRGLLISNEAYRHNIQLECMEQFIEKLSEEVKEKIRLELNYKKLLEEAGKNLDNAENLRLEAQKSVEEAEGRVNNLKGNFHKVEEGINSLLDQNIIIGAFGALVGATFSPLGAGLLALAAPTLFAIGPNFYIPKSELKCDFKEPEKKGEVKMGFYTKSTGLFAFWKNGSSTAGVISIHVGNEVKNYPFNLNESKNDYGLNVATITKDLFDAFETKHELLESEFLGILNQLGNIPCGEKTYEMISKEKLRLNLEALRREALRNNAEKKDDLSSSQFWDCVIESNDHLTFSGFMNDVVITNI